MSTSVTESGRIFSPRTGFGTFTFVAGFSSTSRFSTPNL
jgi:hypothetical protein